MEDLNQECLQIHLFEETMKEPKYLLVFERAQHLSNSFAIYEQAHIGGQVGQRLHSRHVSIDAALFELFTLNGEEPVLLAYSTKPIDNTFAV